MPIRWIVPVVALALGAGAFATNGGANAAVRSADAVAATTPSLQYCFGKIKRVEDGDTVDVKLTKACKTWPAGHVVVVRNAGIQTTEHHDTKPNAAGGEVYECWAKPAQTYFTNLMPQGTKVRLSFWHITKADEQTTTGATRYFMYVDARLGGTWVDVQAKELRAGLAMWKPEAIERAHNADYAVPFQEAMRAGAGMWGDPARCGATAYEPGADLQAWIEWKTNGRDTTDNANEEWFKIRNAGPTQVDLSGWKVRDAGHRFNQERTTYLTFPPGTILQPGAVLTLYPTDGTNDLSKLKFYNNRSRLPFYANVPWSGDRTFGSHLGAKKGWPGAANYLLDPKLNFRAWAVYPCVTACSSAPMPAPPVSISSIVKDSNEQVLIDASTPADLTGLSITYNGFTKELPEGTLTPGSPLTIHIVKSGQMQPDTLTDAYWRHDTTYSPTRMLSNDDGSIWLRTADGVTVDFESWGNGGSYDYTK